MKPHYNFTYNSLGFVLVEYDNRETILLSGDDAEKFKKVVEEAEINWEDEDNPNLDKFDDIDDYFDSIISTYFAIGKSIK